MARQLLNAVFKAGDYEVRLGCNSLGYKTPENQWVYSKDQTLGQIGCMVINYSYHPLSNLAQTYLWKELNEHGYSGMCILKDTAELDVPLYLNGMSTVDGEPQPYVKFEGSPAQLVYYQANHNSLGSVLNVSQVVPGTRDNALLVLGKIYDDGTYVIQRGGISPHYVSGVPSNKYYDWFVYPGMVNNPEDTQNAFIRPSILEDLAQYSPVEPEGEGMDPGVGDFDSSSDAIGYPGLPGISAIDTGMTAIYQMTSTQLKDFAHYLWTDWTSLGGLWDNIKKMFNDPMQAILNLSIQPISYNGLQVGNVKIGNINTECYGSMLTTPYKIINFGTINLHEYWGSFADYSPYTKLSIFLPYIGSQSISIDDVMNGSIQLKAYCDVLTGTVQYMLYSVQRNHRGHSHASILYTWGGNMQYQIPLSASNFSSVVSSLIGAGASIASGLATMAVTEGAGTPIAVGMTSSAIGQISKAKQETQRSGGLGGAVGLFGVQTPYLILERPEQVYPSNYAHTIGIPNVTSDYLKSYQGFVKVKDAHIEIVSATETELNDILEKLKEGVVI